MYRTALLYLQRLGGDIRFCETLTKHGAEVFLVGALLHDIGHWPFCHPLEDIRDERIPRHEELAKECIGGELAELLDRDWSVAPEEVNGLLCGEGESPSARLMSSLLSGPIDIDKMDYLRRDSLHAGVPYGQNFDRTRLISSLCLNEDGDALAITEKGRTAVEMMVFARYVMFSEVYWHHTVRAATAMLQRAFLSLTGDLDLHELFRLEEQTFVAEILSRSQSKPAAKLLDGLFGKKRSLYKRVDQFSLFQKEEVYHRLARKPYPWLVECATALASCLSRELNTSIPASAVLIDAPPTKREVEIKVDVFYPKENCYRQLSEVSPVVCALAQEQFDDYVKRGPRIRFTGYRRQGARGGRPARVAPSRR